MAKKTKTKTKTNNKTGGFINDLANLALIPGLATYGAFKLNQKIKKKNSKKKNSKKKNKQDGGFIRDHSTQHFYSNCNKNSSVSKTWDYKPSN